MSQENVETYVLQLAGQDQGALQLLNSAQDSLAGITDQTEQLNSLNAQAAGQYSDLADAAQQLGLSQDQLAAMVDDTEQLVGKNQALAESYDQVAQSAAGAAGAEADVSGGGGGDGGDDGEGGGFSFGGLRGGLRAAGRLAGGGGGDILRDASSLVALTTAFGPFGAALGLGELALHAVTGAEEARAAAAQKTADALAGTAGETSADLQKQIDAQAATKQSVQGGIDALTSYGQQLDGLHDKQLQLAQDAAAAQANGTYGGAFDTLTSDQIAVRQSLKDRGDALSESFTDLNAKIYDATEGNLGLKDGLGLVVTGSADLTGALQDGQAKLKTASDAAAFLAVQINSTATAANNAAAAQSAQAKEIDQNAQYTLQANAMTADQRKQRAAELQNEITLYDGLIAGAKGNNQAEQALGDQQAALINQYEALISVTDSYADHAARLAATEQAVTDQNSQYLTSLQNLGNTESQITQTTQDMAQARLDEQASEQQVITDGQAKINDIIAKGNDDQAKLTQSNEDSKNKILRDSGRAEQDDIGLRDALKFQQDDQHKQDELADQQLHFTEAEQQLQQSLASQEAAEKTSEDRRLHSLEDALAKKEQSEELSLQHEQVDAINFQSQLAAIHVGGYGGLEQIAVNAFADMQPVYYNAGISLAASLLEGVRAGVGQGAGSLLSSGGISGVGLPVGQSGGFSVGGLDNHIANTVVGVFERLYEDMRS